MTRLDIIKNGVRTLNALSTHDLVAVLTIYETIDYISELDDVVMDDIKYIDKWTNSTYLSTDLTLYSDDFKEFLLELKEEN